MSVYKKMRDMLASFIEKTSPKQRTCILVVSDSFISSLTLAMSFFVFYSLNHGLAILKTHAWLFGLFVVVRIVAFKLFGLYAYMWRYASTREFIAIFKAVTLSTVAIIFALFLAGVFPYHKGIFLLDWLLNVFWIGSTRVFLKVYREHTLSIYKNTGELSKHRQKNVLIIGAGEAAVICAREILRAPKLMYHLVGFVDDNPEKVGRMILQAPVLGKTSEILSVVRKHNIEEAIIAMPSVSGAQIRSILELCEKAKIKFKTTPSLADIIDGRFTFSQIREVRIEDLLRRDIVTLNSTGIEAFLSDRVVLVTGAGGSIGSELCRQILKYEPKTLVMVDLSENFMYHIEHELTKEKQCDITVIPIVLDVKNRHRLESVFKTYQPDVVFHAAAHKHVPLMEENVQEVMENNIVGTKNVLELSAQYAVKEAVLISTDKAVRTTNCMGATKRICEILLQIQAQSGTTKFAAVRFGNVLGSHGSVVPLFKRQIAKGGPLTVTHEDMTRFFMTIPEAVSLVLQAGSLSQGGEIFILDMGKPVKIMDLARDMISLSGLKEGKDITIQVTGLRPGEKLHEELYFDQTDLKETAHKKIFIAVPRPYNAELVRSQVNELLQFAQTYSNKDMKEKLLDFVLNIQPETIDQGLSHV